MHCCALRLLLLSLTACARTCITLYISQRPTRSYIADDELVEVTPKIVRLRKKKLDPTERKKLVRQAA